MARLAFPHWTRRRAARAIRAVGLHIAILPFVRTFTRVAVDGREHVQSLSGPVLFAANHQGHVDMPSLLLALPWRLRTRVGVAVSRAYFDAYFAPRPWAWVARWTSGLVYGLVALFFQAFPLPQQPPGLRSSLRFAAHLVGQGVSVLVFPEGRRTEAGELHPFRPGVGLLALRLGIPVVPVRLEGSDRVWHRSWRRPRRGVVTVRFGAARRFVAEAPEVVADEVERAVRALESPSCSEGRARLGATTF